MSTRISPQAATELAFCMTRFSSGRNFESSFEIKLPCSPATFRDWECPEGPMLPRCWFAKLNSSTAASPLRMDVIWMERHVTEAYRPCVEREYYSPMSGPTTSEGHQHSPKMEVIRMVQRVCKQTRVGCDCCDSFCVLRRSSAAPQFFRVKPIWFFGKKKKRRKLAKKEEKGRAKGRLCQNTPKTNAKKREGGNNFAKLV